MVADRLKITIMELVLNHKNLNTIIENREEEPEPIIFGKGILNSTYKNEIKHTPRDPKSLLSVKKRVYKYQMRFSQNIETILKVSVFAIVLFIVLY